MYPDLSYLFHDIFGTAPDNWTAIFKTFGLFLFLAFVSAGYVYYKEVLRKEKEGLLSAVCYVSKSTTGQLYRETILNAALAFFFAYKIPYIASNFSAFKQDPAAVVFSAGGNIILGILVGIGALYFYFSQAKKNIKPAGTKFTFHPHQKVGDIAVYAALFGILGAKFFAISENLDAFFRDPIGQIFSGSGLTVYGGLIVASLAMMFYIKKILKLPLLPMIDAAAPAIIMGQLVGRLGCQFSGDGDWGMVNAAAKPSWFVFPDWMWSYGYPNNVSKAGEKMADCPYEYCFEIIPGVYPTPIYEVLMYAAIFGFLWFLRKRINISGIQFFAYMILSGIARFLIEYLRVNDHYEFLGFNGSQAHYISLVFILIGIVGIFFLVKKGNTNAIAVQQE